MSPALAGYRARTCDVLEEAEGALCVQPGGDKSRDLTAAFH